MIDGTKTGKLYESDTKTAHNKLILHFFQARKSWNYSIVLHK